jgi:hypothetical protein
VRRGPLDALEAFDFLEVFDEAFEVLDEAFEVLDALDPLLPEFDR